MAYVFAPQAAIDVTTGRLVNESGLSGNVYGSLQDAQAEVSPLSVTVPGGIPSTEIPVSPNGQSSEFSDETHVQVWWRSGPYIVHLFSFDGLIETIEAAQLAAETAAASAASAIEGAVFFVNGNSPIDGNVDVAGGGGSATWTGISGKPSTFPPSPHSHTRSEISDSTSLGRALLGAADAQAARSAIGAGTGNGTSNLTLGSSGSQAMPGNRSFSDAEITAGKNGNLPAGTVRSQLASLDSRTGSVSSDTVTVKWSSGAYPGQPALPPAGVQVRRFYGPVAPSVPTWPGVLDVYEYADL